MHNVTSRAYIYPAGNQQKIGHPRYLRSPQSPRNARSHRWNSRSRHVRAGYSTRIRLQVEFRNPTSFANWDFE